MLDFGEGLWLEADTLPSAGEGGGLGGGKFVLGTTLPSSYLSTTPTEPWSLTHGRIGIQKTMNCCLYLT